MSARAQRALCAAPLPLPQGFISTIFFWGLALSGHSFDRLQQHCPVLSEEYSQFLLVATAPHSRGPFKSHSTAGATSYGKRRQQETMLS